MGQSFNLFNPPVTIFTTDNKISSTLSLFLTLLKKDLYFHLDLNVPLGNEHMKRCSKSLVIKKMRIKSTMRYHNTPTRMAIIRKTDNNKC